MGGAWLCYIVGIAKDKWLCLCVCVCVCVCVCKRVITTATDLFLSRQLKIRLHSTVRNNILQKKSVHGFPGE